MADKTRRLTTHPAKDLLRTGDVFFLPSIERLKEWEDKSLGAPVAYLVAGFEEAYMKVFTLEAAKEPASQLVHSRDIPTPGAFKRLLNIGPESTEASATFLRDHLHNLLAAHAEGWSMTGSTRGNIAVKAFKLSDGVSPLHPLLRFSAGYKGAVIVNAGFVLDAYGLGLIEERFVEERDAANRPTSLSVPYDGYWSLTDEQKSEVEAFLKRTDIDSRIALRHLPIPTIPTKEVSNSGNRPFILDPKRPGTDISPNYKSFSTFAEAAAACAAVMANTQPFPLRATNPRASSETT